MIFYNSGIDFWRQNPSRINCKMTSKIACLNLTHFGLKIRHKIPPRRSQDAHMTPQEDPRRSKTSPRRLQDASKTTPRRLPDGPRYSQDAPKTALNSPSHPKMFPWILNNLCILVALWGHVCDFRNLFALPRADN